MADEAYRYLVILHLNDSSVDRLRTLIPSLQKVLERISIAPTEQLFRSVTADVFGYLITSRLEPGQISAAIESPNRKHRDLNEPGAIDPFMTNSDGIAVIEIGDKFTAGYGFTRAGTWLQHH